MKSAVNICSIALLIISGRFFIEFDLLPTPLLLPVVLFVFIAISAGYYYTAKPENIRLFSWKWSCTVCAVMTLLTLIEHLVLKNDFSLNWRHTLFLSALAFTVPAAVGLTYAMLFRRD